MATTHRLSTAPDTPTRGWWLTRWINRRTVGCFYLFTSGIHVGLVGADAEVYRTVADEALFAWVQEGWQEIFMAAPAVWGLLVAALELSLGLLLLLGRGRAVLLGWAGVIGFHLAVMLLGWGYWVWCVPALALLVPAARAEVRR